jgi:hypothetical protein
MRTVEFEALPAGSADGFKIRMVEIAGIEPATSGLQSRRSPN